MKKTITSSKRKARIGRLFILPFTLGFIFFFLQPLLFSLYYSFTQNSPKGNTMIFSWIGLNNYRFLFQQDTDFLPTLFVNLNQMITQVPVIVMFSLFIAVVLNQRFKGRTFVRAVFFLPVIISSGIIISILYQDVFNQSIRMGSAQTAYIFQSSGLSDILYSSNLPVGVITFITNILSSIFDMLWKTGVQILIFLAAIQGVPLQLYEAAKVEGATGWESFWKITFPIISPMILVNVIYSIVDSFTDYLNPMMRLINDIGFRDIRYSYASAMGWIYMLIVLSIILMVNLVIGKLVFYRSE